MKNSTKTAAPIAMTGPSPSNPCSAKIIGMAASIAGRGLPRDKVRLRKEPPIQASWYPTSAGLSSESSCRVVNLLRSSGTVPIGRSHSFAGYLAGLLHPFGELSFVELVVLVDIQIADFLLLGLAGWERSQRRA